MRIVNFSMAFGTFQIAHGPLNPAGGPEPACWQARPLRFAAAGALKKRLIASSPSGRMRPRTWWSPLKIHEGSKWCRNPFPRWHLR